MKLPSLQSFLDKSFETLARFPMVLLSALAGVYAAMRMADLNYDEHDARVPLTRILMTAWLGLTLFLSLKIYGERRNLKAKVEALLHLAGVGLLVLYFLSLHNIESVHSIVHYILFTIGLHLLVSVAPFLSANEPNGFWQYNKTLFLRFLTSALYSGVLFIGLALALLAIDHLFEVHIHERWYLRLWIFIAGIVNTWFFLAGVPEKFQALEGVTEYPRGLKIFTQYILLPIITVYMIILYGYEIKILVTSHWPVGWVSYLVLAFSIAGILSLLLIWPIRETADNEWMKGYSRFFYMALFPLIAMLFIAIFKRVVAYGVTENRYFLMVLALWLTCISLYFVFSKAKNIKLIPLSLCIIAFLSSFGPWGAFSISKHSQYKRLYALLEKNKLVTDGKVHKATNKVPVPDSGHITSIVEYLVKVHGVGAIQPLFAEHLPDEEEGGNSWRYGSRYDIARDVLDSMGVEYTYTYEGLDEAEATEQEKQYSYSTAESDYMDISGYDVLLDYYSSGRGDGDTAAKEYHLKSETVRISYNFEEAKLKFLVAENEFCVIDVREVSDKIRATHLNSNDNINPSLLTVEDSCYYKTKVIFTRLNLSELKGKTKVSNLSAKIFLKRQ